MLGSKNYCFQYVSRKLSCMNDVFYIEVICVDG